MSRALLVLALVACAHGRPITPTSQPSGTVVVDFLQSHPLDLHRGIWRDVCRCLGLEVTDWGDLPFATARMLVGDSFRAYGMTVFENGIPRGIIVDREYRLHPGVVSHEVIHARTGVSEHDPALFRCEMRLPSGGLVLRPMSPDSVAHYRRLATGGDA